MNRIDRCFERLRQQGRKAFIAYLSSGDPDMETTRAAALSLLESGVDIIELGLPFSDPLADGPVIQAAGQRSLQAGFCMDRFWELAAAIRCESDAPLTVMTYYNPVMVPGNDIFVKRASECGIDGVLVPDLPLEEAAELEEMLENRNMHAIRFLAPTTDPERMRRILTDARGFVYCVSLTGVTGVRQEINRNLHLMLREARQHTDLPLCVGFGISKAAQAAEVGEIADGIIIGSAIVRLIEEKFASGRAQLIDELRRFALEIRASLDGQAIRH